MGQPRCNSRRGVRLSGTRPLGVRGRADKSLEDKNTTFGVRRASFSCGNQRLRKTRTSLRARPLSGANACITGFCEDDSDQISVVTDGDSLPRGKAACLRHEDIAVDTKVWAILSSNCAAHFVLAK